MKSCKLQNANVAYDHDLLSWQLTKNSSKIFLSSFIRFFIDGFLANTNISNIFHDNFFQNTPYKYTVISKMIPSSKRTIYS